MIVLTDHQHALLRLLNAVDTGDESDLLPYVPQGMSLEDAMLAAFRFYDQVAAEVGPAVVRQFLDTDGGRS